MEILYLNQNENYECKQNHFILRNNTIIFSKEIERKNVIVKCDYMNDFELIFFDNSSINFSPSYVEINSVSGKSNPSKRLGAEQETKQRPKIIKTHFLNDIKLLKIRFKLWLKDLNQNLKDFKKLLFMFFKIIYF